MDLEVIYYNNLRLNSLNTVNDNDLIILIASNSKLSGLPNPVFYSGTIFCLVIPFPVVQKLEKFKPERSEIDLNRVRIGRLSRSQQSFLGGVPNWYRPNGAICQSIEFQVLRSLLCYLFPTIHLAVNYWVIVLWCHWQALIK